MEAADVLAKRSAMTESTHGDRIQQNQPSVGHGAFGATYWLFLQPPHNRSNHVQSLGR
jgi:hypothetical protein